MDDELVDQATRWAAMLNGSYDENDNADGQMVDALLDRIEALTAEVRRLDYSTIHTCWDECPRLPCAQRREIEALTAQLAEARESERAAMTELNACKDALAQVPEFICRKCGRRQDGPTDNEARF